MCTVPFRFSIRLFMIWHRLRAALAKEDVVCGGSLRSLLGPLSKLKVGVQATCMPVRFRIVCSWLNYTFVRSRVSAVVLMFYVAAGQGSVLARRHQHDIS
mmetsp:Transcript_70903/g.179471  ORF Transcript_70903/g.179471 Transcript_70903/m.179471 type:complete len:100 (-) Transcript_70903:102-401(-)